MMWNARVDSSKLEDSLNFAMQLKRLLNTPRVVRTEQFEGKDVWVVSGKMAWLPLVLLYFEKESGLLVRLIHYNGTAGGWFPTQTDYSDYRVVDGVMVPFRWTVALIRGRRLTYQMEEVLHNVVVDESVFKMPVPQPPYYQ
jgi:hypothetical protein